MISADWKRIIKGEGESTLLTRETLELLNMHCDSVDLLAEGAIRIYSVDIEAEVIVYQAKGKQISQPVENVNLMAELAKFRVINAICQSHKESRAKTGLKSVK